MSTRLEAIRAIVWRDVRLASTAPVPFAFDVLGVLAAMALYYFIGRFARGGVEASGAGYFVFAASGIAVLRMQAAVGRTLQNLEREQTSGTLELVLMAPVPSWLLVVASAIYELVRAIVFALAVLVLARFVFGAGLTLGPRAWAGIAMGIAAAVAFFLGLAAMCAGVLIAFRHGRAFAGLIALGLPVLSGAFYPPRVLPQPLEALTHALPISPAIQCLRGGVQSAVFLPEQAGLAVGLSAVYVVIGLVFLEWAIRRAKRRGTLGQY